MPKSFDLIHELLNFIILLFYFLAYTSILQKLRQEKTASYISLQMLFSFIFTELSKVMLSIIAFLAFSSPLRTAQLVCRCITCFVSVVVYAAAVRRMGVVDWDTFGKISRMKPQTRKKKSTHFLGIRFHWIALYIFALVGGSILQWYRRHSKIPSWFGLYECFVGMCIIALLQ